MPIQIEVEGVDTFRKNIGKFGTRLTKHMVQAGIEAGKVVLATKGLQNYPPHTAANLPPVPYYKRGTGMVTSKGVRRVSENLGKKWTVKQSGFNTVIANTASYAKWVHGDMQAVKMGEKGWRKLTEVVNEKVGKIRNIYQKHIIKALQDAGLM